MAEAAGGAGGASEKRRFLDLVRDFIVFKDLGGGKLAKKMAAIIRVPRRDRGDGARLHRLPRRRGDRRNIVVVRRRYDAHRSQSDCIDGFARHMRDAVPNLGNEPVAARRRITLTLPPT